MKKKKKIFTLKRFFYYFFIIILFAQSKSQYGDLLSMKVLRERASIQAATIFTSFCSRYFFTALLKSETPSDMLLKPFCYQKLDFMELLRSLEVFNCYVNP